MSVTRRTSRYWPIVCCVTTELLKPNKNNLCSIRVSVFKYTELFIDSKVCQAESELLCQSLGEHRGLPINTSLATPDKYLL